MERAPIQRVLFTSHPVRPYVDTIGQPLSDYFVPYGLDSYAGAHGSG
jgi:hypothetical protein